MKKILLYLLVVSVLVVMPVLAACNGGGETTTTPATTTPTTTTPTTTTPTTTTPTTTTPTTTTPATTTPTTTTPTTTTPTTTQPSPPALPSSPDHSGYDVSMCIACHGPSGANPYPGFHADYADDSCLGCHQSSAATTTPPPTTTTTQPPTHDELSDTYKYTIIFTGPEGLSGTYKVWVKGEKIKLEILVEEQGQQTSVIFIDDGVYEYVYMPDNGGGYASRYPSGSGMSPAAGFDVFAGFFTEYYTVYASDAAILAEWEIACAADPQCQSVSIVGHENISGEDCTIFEVVLADGTESRVWLATNKGYVLKVENITTEGTYSIEFSDIDLDADIPDSMFELPEGVTIM